jgi:predicted nucleic-acid-binding protein
LWTLRKLYGFDRTSLQELLDKLLSTSTFCFENRANVSQASALFAKTAADYSDCLIAVQNAHLGADTTVTFDKAMAVLPMVEVLRAKAA